MLPNRFGPEHPRVNRPTRRKAQADRIDASDPDHFSHYAINSKTGHPDPDLLLGPDGTLLEPLAKEPSNPPQN